MNNDFMTHVKHWTTDHSLVQFVSCHFHVENYHIELFERNNIYLPESVRQSVAKRQAEFLAGRYMAKLALLKSGFDASNSPVITIGNDRSPIWPSGYLGSITHNKSIAICAIGKGDKISLLGIDIEMILDDEMSSEIATQIHDGFEKDILVHHGFTSKQATTLIFSAKETIFKALYPSIKAFFGFESFQVKSIDVRQQTMTFQINDVFHFKTKVKNQYTVHYQNFTNAYLTYLVTIR